MHASLKSCLIFRALAKQNPVVYDHCHVLDHFRGLAPASSLCVRFFTSNTFLDEAQMLLTYSKTTSIATFCVKHAIFFDILR